MRQVAPRLGFSFEDWAPVVENYRREEDSHFSPFALHADHCHHSSIGTRLATGKIRAALAARGAAGAAAGRFDPGGPADYPRLARTAPAPTPSP